LAELHHETLVSGSPHGRRFCGVIYPKGKRVMYSFVKIFIIVVLSLAVIDWLADRDRRADTNIPKPRPDGRFFQVTSK